jgi:hypothetical protein
MRECIKYFALSDNGSFTMYQKKEGVSKAELRGKYIALNPH